MAIQFNSLSSDELGIILQYFSSFHIVNCLSLVSKRWNEVALYKIPLKIKFKGVRGANLKVDQFVKYLSDKSLGDESVMNITELDLNCLNLGDEKFQILLKQVLTKLPNLQHLKLDLRKNGFTNEVCKFLKEIPETLQNEKIQEKDLNLEENSQVPINPFSHVDFPLTHLDLSEIPLKVSDIDTLFTNRFLSKLKSLRLIKCGLGLEAAETISKYGGSEQNALVNLEELNLDGNHIRTRGALMLITNPYWERTIKKFVFNPDLTYNMGFCFENGEGVEKNDEKALYYFKLSAEQGFMNGIVGVGEAYQTGALGLSVDLLKAIEYYKKALDLGENELDLHYRIGELYYHDLKDPKSAFETFTNGARRGSIYSQYFLAILYRNGYGCERSLSSSFMFLKLSSLIGSANARYGHPMACIYKGHTFYSGEEFPKYSLSERYIEAFKCYECALKISNRLETDLACLNILALSFSMGENLDDKQKQTVSTSQKRFQDRFDITDQRQLRKFIKEFDYDKLSITKESCRCGNTTIEEQICIDGKLAPEEYCAGCKIFKRDNPILFDYLRKSELNSFEMTNQ